MKQMFWSCILAVNKIAPKKYITRVIERVIELKHFLIAGQGFSSISAGSTDACLTRPSPPH